MLIDEVELETFLQRIREQSDRRCQRCEPPAPGYRHAGARGRVVYGPAGRPRVRLLPMEPRPERAEALV